MILQLLKIYYQIRDNTDNLIGVVGDEMKKIRHWHQETAESGRWIETGPLKEATVEILIKHFDQPEILDCTEEEIKYWKLHDEIVTLRSRLKIAEKANKKLLQELIECSYDLQCSCDHPACKPCERHGQLSEFIEEMKKAI